jgi:hypothetical protein
LKKEAKGRASVIFNSQFSILNFGNSRSPASAGEMQN